MLITFEVPEDKAVALIKVAEDHQATVVANDDSYEVDFDDPNMPEWHKEELRKRLAEHDPSTDITFEEFKDRMMTRLSARASKV